MLEEAVGMNDAYHRPPPAISHGGRNSPRDSDADELLRILYRSITEWVKEGETAGGEDDEKDKDSKVSVKAEDEKTTKSGKVKQATTNTLNAIAEYYVDVLAFLQAVAVKSLQVIAAPLSLRADKRARIWFCCWTDVNLPTPPNPAPQ